MDLAGLAWTVALIHLAGHALAQGRDVPHRRWRLSRRSEAMPLVQSGVLRAKPVAVRRWRAVRGDEPGGDASAGRICQRMVPVSNFFPGLPSGEPRQPSRRSARRRRAGADRRPSRSRLSSKRSASGLLGRAGPAAARAPWRTSLAVGALGGLVLALAAGMPLWLSALKSAIATAFASNAADAMRDGWLLVPLTSKFAFISPSKLVIVMPLLALAPIALVLLALRRRPRLAPVWYGGASEEPPRAATTALTFSNALAHFLQLHLSADRGDRTRNSRKGSRQPYFIRGCLQP